MLSTSPSVGKSSARTQCVCAYCKNSFKPKHSTRRTYCSRECAFKHKAAAPPYSRVYSGYCGECNKPFVSKRTRSHCGISCQRKATYISIAPSTRKCNCCGKEFQAPKAVTRPSDFCSVECKAETISKHKRVSRLKRKAQQREVTVESVDPFKVFERDGWKCRLCGVDTPRHKRGTYDDDAPELDHIIPLSKKGEHSYLNTQCTCRKCNAEKSDRLIG